MSEIDWSKAPEGAVAVIFHKSQDRGDNETIYLKDFSVSGGELYGSSVGRGKVRALLDCWELVERPSSPAWNGEGLPPVGMVCELSIEPEKDDDYPINKWLRGDRLEVIAYRVVYGKELPVVWNERHQSASSVVFECLRPIRTPEQIAAEERERAVKEMIDIAKTCLPFPDVRDIINALYTAGYRKTEG